MSELVPIEVDENYIDYYNEVNEEDEIILPDYGEGPGDRVREWVSEVRPETPRRIDPTEWSDDMYSDNSDGLDIWNVTSVYKDLLRSSCEVDLKSEWSTIEVPTIEMIESLKWGSLLKEELIYMSSLGYEVEIGAVM